MCQNNINNYNYDFKKRAQITGFCGLIESLTEIEHLIYSGAPFSFKPYKALSDEQRAAADFGIKRHLRACKRADLLMRFDPEAIREIVIDAARNRPYWVDLERENRLNREIINEARNSGFINKK